MQVWLWLCWKLQPFIYNLLKTKECTRIPRKVFRLLGFTLKITLKTLVFGYKCSYNAYEELNTILSHIFYAIYKYWIKNDMSIDIKHWIFIQLRYWLCIYAETKTNNLLKEFICKWLEVDTNTLWPVVNTTRGSSSIQDSNHQSKIPSKSHYTYQFNSMNLII